MKYNTHINHSFVKISKKKKKSSKSGMRLICEETGCHHPIEIPLQAVTFLRESVSLYGCMRDEEIRND